MSDLHLSLLQLLSEDDRYKPEAYFFVRDALTYAQEELGLGRKSRSIEGAVGEAHLTGQELCHAIRQYAISEYGFLAIAVFRNWGITRTGDFGEIVYNMIKHDVMRKSENDRREDFDDVYDFDHAFVKQFEFRIEVEEETDEEDEGEQIV